MRQRDFDKKMKSLENGGQITFGEAWMMDVFYEHIKHGNARHRNWLKRKCFELGKKLDTLLQRCSNG
jgi:hypothetical protein